MFVLRAAPKGALCALLAVSSFASPAAALTESLPAPPPALRTAIHDLWRKNPQVQAADANLRAARERASAAGRPVYNPSIQLDGENADVDRRTAGVSLTLDAFGKRRARVTESDAEVRAREAAYTRERRDVALDWLKAWSTIALAREQSVLGRRRVDLMRRFDGLAEQRFKVGDISRPERDLAGLAFGEARVQQSTLDAQELVALSALATLGTDPVGPLPALPTTLPPGASRAGPR